MINFFRILFRLPGQLEMLVITLQSAATRWEYILRWEEERVQDLRYEKERK